MLNIEKKTRLGPGKVVEKAVAFFGPKGLGMDLVEQDRCCARFRGGGGFVLVQTEELGDQERTKVVLQGREWETPMKEFLAKL